MGGDVARAAPAVRVLAAPHGGGARDGAVLGGRAGDALVRVADLAAVAVLVDVAVLADVLVGVAAQARAAVPVLLALHARVLPAEVHAEGRGAAARRAARAAEEGRV